MLTSLYIHIPFCEHICTYCDFHKELATEKKQTLYVNALCKELIHRRNDLVNIKTVYIGGGTPLSLNNELLTQLLETINEVVMVNQIVEFTIESNPNNIDKPTIELLRHYGVNRLSIGVQTFDEKQLKFLGRDHQLSDVQQSIALLQSMSFPNISIDMMFSLINQTIEELQYDIDQVLSLNVDHISYYSLILEEKTKLHHLLQQGNISMNTEELEEIMYNIVIDGLTAKGYHQYEISNFAKDNRESFHNKAYWLYENYLGVGSGAHSFVDGVRFYHEPNVTSYINRIESGNFTPHIEYEVHDIGDEMMMGLRLIKGVPIEYINRKYDIDLLEKYPEIQNHIDNNLLEINNGYIRLTRKGIMLGNIVFATFVEVV